ncbi:MAG: PriCT-2 domain-containing protein [Chromatiaceae bacterium]
MSALQAIDLDIGYSDWLRIGMALHAAGGGFQEALDLWDVWSREGNSYREGETAYRWQTFHSDLEQGVGLGTLFHLAKEAGWDGQLGSDDKTMEAAERQGRSQLMDFEQCYRAAMIEGKATIVYIDKDTNTGAQKIGFSSWRGLPRRPDGPCRRARLPSQLAAYLDRHRPRDGPRSIAGYPRCDVSAYQPPAVKGSG